MKYIYDCPFDTRGPKKLVLEDKAARNLFCDLADDFKSKTNGKVGFQLSRGNKHYTVYIEETK